MSIVAFGLSLLNSAAALLSQWAVNAEALGAHDFGLAISFAFGGAFSLIISMYAAPVLLLLSGGAALVHRPAALWLLAAAIVSGAPLAILSLLGR